MKMTLEDRSLYFKGLLLLIKKDFIITPEEKEMLMRLGALLQFNADFCELTIKDLLHNKHIDDEPLIFSNKECANVFLMDSIKVAFADDNLHIKEYEWMQNIATANDISQEWLSIQLHIFLNSTDENEKNTFEIQKYSSRLAVTLPSLGNPVSETGHSLPIYLGKKRPLIAATPS